MPEFFFTAPGNKVMAAEEYDKSSEVRNLKLQLHDAIYRLRFYSNSLIHILSLSIRTIT